MGWFDEQIRLRKQYDEDVFAEAMNDIVGSVTGKNTFFTPDDDRKIIKNEIDEILKYYRLKSRDLPDGIKDFDEQLEYLLRPHGIMRRKVVLKDKWYKNASGPFLARRKSDNAIVALIPDKNSNLAFLDRVKGKNVKLSKENADLFEKEAICLYKPFPLEEMNTKELWKNFISVLSKRDLILFGAFTLAAMLLGTLIPVLYNFVFKYIINDNSIRPLISVSVFLVSIVLSISLINSAKNLVGRRIADKLRVNVESAIMIRILSLPAGFFKKHSSGELASKLQAVPKLCEKFVNGIVTVSITAIFSLVYVTEIYIYTPSLCVYALLILAVTLLFSVVLAVIKAKNMKKQIEYALKEQGMSYALITGIQKIKLAGAQKRAFARWGTAYAKSAGAKYNPPFVIKISETLGMAITLIGGIVIYYVAAVTKVSVSDFYAFNSAYAVVSGAFALLPMIAVSLAEIKPIMEKLSGFFKVKPEISVEKQVVSRISGGIELNNISFRYDENMPNVIDNLSLKIRPGQYVAIVGTTGCGKSTLMRLMLGFEKPDKGAVYYDGKDIEKLDLKSLRTKIGVVMQEGKLFQGDIFSNIAISSPNLTLEQAWEAAEKAGIAEDIKNMPMGMNTVISEGSGGISGGQRQRILIARAIASKPKILMFDEATSALDNITQKIVSESLDSLKCTRIVIAHRLSTIKHCNRIIVLDKGKVAEDGTYDELVEKNGLFAELISRQKV